MANRAMEALRLLALVILGALYLLGRFVAWTLNEAEEDEWALIQRGCIFVLLIVVSFLLMGKVVDFVHPLTQPQVSTQAVTVSVPTMDKVEQIYTWLASGKKAVVDGLTWIGSLVGFILVVRLAMLGVSSIIDAYRKSGRML